MPASQRNSTDVTPHHRHSRHRSSNDDDDDARPRRGDDANHDDDNDNEDGQLTAVRRAQPLTVRRGRGGDGGADDVGAPVQYAQVDPRTHAKQYYHNDGRGTQAYAYYYNSDQDPSYNRSRNSRNGSGASQMRTAMCCYTGTTTSSDGDSGSNARATRRRTRATAPPGEPIVEEPDDDNDNDSRHVAGGGRGAVALPQAPVDVFAAMQRDMMAAHRQMLSAMAMPHHLLGDDWFGDAFATTSSSRRRHGRGANTAAAGNTHDPFDRFFF